MKNMILMIGLFFVLTACSKQNFQTIDTDNKFLASATYSFNVDVLWVVDNSFRTMEVHQNRIAQKMENFYNGLVANQANFRIAATTMDMNSGGAQGELLGSVPVVTRSTPNAVARLEELLKRGGDGASAERGLLAMQTALQKEQAKGSRASFLRDDALLVVVFVTDDEDFGLPANPISKANIYRDFLNNLKGENTANEQKWVANYIGITDLNDPLCTTYGSYSSRGEAYLELARMSGGVIESICETDFGSYVDQITVRLKSVLNRYQLKSRPLLDSLTVYINGVLVRKDDENGWSYDEAKNTVILNGSARPGPNDDVKIEYEIIEL